MNPEDLAKVAKELRGRRLPRWALVVLPVAVMAGCIGCESLGLKPPSGIELPVLGGGAKPSAAADPLAQCWATVDKLVDATTGAGLSQATAPAPCADVVDLRAELAKLSAENELLHRTVSDYSEGIHALEAENAKLSREVIECVIGGDDE